MSNSLYVKGNASLLEAQKKALEFGAFFAVIFCLEQIPSQNLIKTLQKVEQDLGRYNIPFIMLIGNAEARLTGLRRHLNPRATYFDDVAKPASLEGEQPSPHPYRWPGVVMSIESLKPRFGEL